MEDKHMALAGKLETEIEIKAPAHKFYNTWKKECYNLPDAAPAHMKAVEVHEGDWESHGSIKLWNYTIGGRTESYKEKIEFDDRNMSVALVGLEGDVFKLYKSWKPIVKITPKESGSVATLTLDYERLNENVPVPHEYLDFMVRVNQDVDAHLTKE